MRLTTIQQNNRSYITSIPKEYAEYFNVERGDVVLWSLTEDKTALNVKIVKDDI